MLVAKVERKSTNVIMYQYGSDGPLKKIPIWKLIQHQFGFRTHCRFFVGVCHSPNPEKTVRFLKPESGAAVSSSKAKNKATNRRKAELPNGRGRVEELALRLEGELLRRKGSVPT